MPLRSTKVPMSPFAAGIESNRNEPALSAQVKLRVPASGLKSHLRSAADSRQESPPDNETAMLSARMVAIFTIDAVSVESRARRAFPLRSLP